MPPCCRKHRGDNVRLVGHKIETVEAKEHDHCEERDSPVAITIRMISYSAVSICRCRTRKIWTPLVRPFMSRSSKGRFEEPFVANARRAAVFSNLIQVYCIDDDAPHPPWFGRLHRSLRQLTQSVAVAFRSASSDRERFLRLGIIRCEKNPIFGFDGQESVAGCQSKAIGHVFRESGANRAADPANGDFFDHVTCFVGAACSMIYVLLVRQRCLSGA